MVLADFGLDKDYDKFPVGTRVRVVCKGRDFHFFRGKETGVVIENKKKYLGIIVKFDKPIEYEDGTKLEWFNFEPEDLEVIGGV